jgi:3-methylornithyl-N6-L-lysine dehydrogenase
MEGAKKVTRLTQKDIHHISVCLEAYNQDLVKKTGRSLLGIACHACSTNEEKVRHWIHSFDVCVVPITAGQGIISEFCETVAAILTFLGCHARVSHKPDVSGMAAAFETRADAVMMADDHRFVGIGLDTGYVADNSVATGRGFASALDLMAGGIAGSDVLVLGCGPVGEAAACKLLFFGARVALFDKDPVIARGLKNRLSNYPGGREIQIEKTLEAALSYHRYILEATPSPDAVPDHLVSKNMLIAAPGVPPGVSRQASEMLGNRVVHDTLEIGVAVMAVSFYNKRAGYDNNAGDAGGKIILDTHSDGPVQRTGN